MKFPKDLLMVKPLYIQIFTASVVCLLSMFATFVLFLIIEFGIDDILFRIKRADGVIEAELFVGVPICTATLLFIHFSKIYPFILYNKKLVMLESVIYLCTTEIAIRIINGFYYKTCILFSIISMLYCAFMTRKLFPKAYQIFQKKIANEYSKLIINKKIDLVLSVILILIFVAPTLIFIFIFF